MIAEHHNLRAASKVENDHDQLDWLTLRPPALPTVVLFTGALFMSGYVLQQRTLNKLRTAVIQQMQPRPSPKIYLPEKFKTQDTAAEFGGSASFLDSQGQKNGDLSIDGSNGDNADTIYVEIRPTEPDVKEGQSSQDSQDIDDAAEQQQLDPETAEKPLSSAARRRKIKEEIRRLAQSGEPVYYQRRLW